MVDVIWWMDLQLPIQSAPITTKVVIQHLIIKFVSDLRKVGGFLRFHPQ